MTQSASQRKREKQFIPAIYIMQRVAFLDIGESMLTLGLQLQCLQCMILTAAILRKLLVGTCLSELCRSFAPSMATVANDSGRLAIPLMIQVIKRILQRRRVTPIVLK